jgi:hypothetical protein
LAQSKLGPLTAGVCATADAVTASAAATTVRKNLIPRSLFPARAIDYILLRQQQRKEVIQCLIVIVCGP